MARIPAARERPCAVCAAPVIYSGRGRPPTMCPTCLPDYNKHWYGANKQHVLDYNTRRRRVVSRKEESRRRRAVLGPREYEQLKAWRAANPEKACAAGRRHRAARRARLEHGVLVIPFTQAQLEARLSMFPGCWMCGGPREEVDHVKPLAAGGAHVLANLRPACGRCNRSKGARWDDTKARLFARVA